MDNREVRPKQVIIYAGAFIAFLIGSGFATGQEIMQYFVSYGWMGIVGAVAVFIGFLYVGVELVIAGFDNKFPKGNDVYTYYCGKYLGKFYDYFSVLFLYMSYIVMIGGAGATLNQQYGLPVAAGGIAMALLAGVTVLFGLNKIVDVIGAIGPVICVMAICLGIAGILMNPSGLAKAPQILANVTMLKASTTWYYAALSYVGFCILWLATFMSQMGKEAQSRKEAQWGAAGGAIGFSLAVILVALGLMANLSDVAGAQVPNLIIAGKIHPMIAVIFSLTIAAGIYTTACPLLWTAVSRFATENTQRYRILTIVLMVIGAGIGITVSFAQLVNFIYVINGYVGILLIILMIAKRIRVSMASSSVNKSV